MSFLTRARLRTAASWTVTTLAALLVFWGLVGPNKLVHLTAGAFVRIPLEALLGVALMLVLPPAARRVVGIVAGSVLGVLAVLKLLDMGFYSTLDRPFDPVLDWILFRAAVEFLGNSIGHTAAKVVAVGVALLALAVPALMALSVLRLTHVVVRHRTASTRTVAVLVVVWALVAALGAQIVPTVPVASDSATSLTYDRAAQVRAGLADRETFAREVRTDAYGDTPPEKLLTALRGKDVLITFVESYGKVALERPEYEATVGAALESGTGRLTSAGYATRSGWLTSPTAGGGSWLAQATLLSGLWINNQQRYRNLVATDRLSLNSAFRRAGWRSVIVMPAVNRAWPEGAYFGCDQIYDDKALGYQGPRFSFSSVPDQYTMSHFQRTERAKPGRSPVMAEIALLSSHAPWTPVPRILDWDTIGDGSVFWGQTDGVTPEKILSRDAARIRTDYGLSIEYSLRTMVDYVERYGDDNLVMVVLGDHQPAPLVTGDGASRDVPITIVSRDRAVMDRVSGWGWNDGLRPAPQAPVWRMDAFRDRFLSAFAN